MAQYRTLTRRVTRLESNRQGCRACGKGPPGHRPHIRAIWPEGQEDTFPCCGDSCVMAGQPDHCPECGRVQVARFTMRYG